MKNTIVIEIKDQETHKTIITMPTATYCVMYQKKNRVLIQYRELKLYNDNETIETSIKERQIMPNEYLIITETEQYFKDALEQAKKETKK